MLDKKPGFISFDTWKYFWHPVCTLHEFRVAGAEGRGPHKVRLLGKNVVLAEIDGEIRAFRDRCCHRSSSLSRGKVAERMEGEYYGSFAALKTDMNSLAIILEELIGDVETAAIQPISGE